MRPGDDPADRSHGCLHRCIAIVALPIVSDMEILSDCYGAIPVMVLSPSARNGKPEDPTAKGRRGVAAPNKALTLVDSQPSKARRRGGAAGSNLSLSQSGRVSGNGPWTIAGTNVNAPKICPARQGQG
jgi:hypothetical protein